MNTIVYLCFFLSGVTGLVYQVLWGKYLALFIGVTAYAHTIVLATFMGGLALGNALFGRIADKHSRPLKIYMILEFGIGIYAAIFPYIFNMCGELYLRLASPEPASGFNVTLKVVFACLLLLFPTVMMGGTLPVLMRFVAREFSGVGFALSTLYFLNSAGAAAGCIIAGFFLIATLGLDASMMIASITNVAIGVVFLLTHRRADIVTVSPISNMHNQQDLESRNKKRTYLLLSLVFCAGFASMVYELVWVRLLSLVLGSSAYSFSLMLFTFITGIAIGGWFAGILQRRQRNILFLFGLCELGVFGSLLIMLPAYERLPYWFHILASLLSRTDRAFFYYHIIQILLCFAVVIIPTICIGIALPLIGTAATESINVVGRRVGNVFSINTLGNVLGAVTAGFLMIPTLGLQHTLQTGILLSGLIGAIALSTGLSGLRRILPITGIIVIFSIASLVTANWNRCVIDSGLYRSYGLTAKSFIEFKKGT